MTSASPKKIFFRLFTRIHRGKKYRFALHVFSGNAGFVSVDLVIFDKSEEVLSRLDLAVLVASGAPWRWTQTERTVCLTGSHLLHSGRAAHYPAVLGLPPATATNHRLDSASESARMSGRIQAAPLSAAVTPLCASPKADAGGGRRLGSLSAAFLTFRVHSFTSDFL